MHTTVYSAATIGVVSHLVDVEVDLSLGLVEFFIVGLPDTAIKESRQRIRTALKNSGLRLPQRKITVNLAPASLRKEGTVFDLPIAVSILLASGDVTCSPAFIAETVFIGELSLEGKIKPVHGALPIAYDMKKQGKKRLIVPEQNASEAALITDIEVIGVASLVELVRYLRNEITVPPAVATAVEQPPCMLDLAQVKGQQQAKRALQISAAGWHNILFIGSPGSGKTMLAKRLASLLPPMQFAEVLEASKVYSVSKKMTANCLQWQRPFRSPHHTISQAGLIGGGSTPQPGEVSLAHKGILFLDELTEFKRQVIEALRQPIEARKVAIARAMSTVEYPAEFLLVAALNPCPCGYFGDKRRTCYCASEPIKRYMRKLSGPLLDRIDIQVPVQSVDYETVVTKTAEKSSACLREAVLRARAVQKERFGSDGLYNSMMNTDQVEQFCVLTEEAQELVKVIFDKLALSMRGYHKVIKVARTIADLEQAPLITQDHIREATLYRSLDQFMDRVSE